MTDSVLITGASRGVGLEFARQYAAHGWRVHACCRDPENAADLRGVMDGHDGAVHTLDVADRRSIDSLKAELNGEALDLLIKRTASTSPWP